MKALTSAIVCLTAVILPSCVDPIYYPPPSREFRPQGPNADRLRAQGRLPELNNPDPFGRDGNRPQMREPEYQERPQVDTTPRRSEYPLATRTANPNQVLSPYKPFNVIDIEGFKSGQLAKDPSNGKIFQIP